MAMKRIRKELQDLSKYVILFSALALLSPFRRRFPAGTGAGGHTFGGAGLQRLAAQPQNNNIYRVLPPSLFV